MIFGLINMKNKINNIGKDVIDLHQGIKEIKNSIMTHFMRLLNNFKCKSK